MSIIEWILSLIAPHHCLRCGTVGHLLCLACTQSLPMVSSCCYRCGTVTCAYRTCAACQPGTVLKAVLPATPYRATAKRLVHSLKFERAKAAADDMAVALITRFNPALYGDVVTYVPTAPQRVRTRGYDQAVLVARAVARRSHLPCYDLLGRSGNQRQVGKSRAARKRQMKQAFYARSAQRIKGRRLVLVDDVLTTGATCEAAAAVLAKAGAAQVTALVFAVAPRSLLKK